MYVCLLFGRSDSETCNIDVINPIPTILTGCTPTLHCSERCIRVYRFFWAPLVACDGGMVSLTLKLSSTVIDELFSSNLCSDPVQGDSTL